MEFLLGIGTGVALGALFLVAWALCRAGRIAPVQTIEPTTDFEGGIAEPLYNASGELTHRPPMSSNQAVILRHDGNVVHFERVV